MNKLVAVLGVIIILLSAMCGILYYQSGDMQSQNSELQNQISQLENQTSELESQLDDLELQNLELQENISKLEELIDFLTDGNPIVRITEFTVTGFNPLINVVIQSDAFVTVQNFGTTRVEGLTVTFEHPSYLVNYSVGVGPLEAGEAKNVSHYVNWALGGPNPPYFFVATLKLDDIILDERTTVTVQ